MQIDFSGKVALVTGAAQGIGFAAARAFAEAGASVMLADRSPAVAASAEKIAALGVEACAFELDVADSDQCESMVAKALKQFGRLDFAFNNAGIGSHYRPISDVPDADWRQMLDINLSGVFYCVKHQIPAMLRTGGGVIVNNSSVLGTRALPDTSVEYTAAKHGVIGLTRQVAVNHGAEGIRCLAICPGLIDTQLVDPDSTGGIAAGGIPPTTREWFLQRTPLARIGQPEDIGRSVVLMCSEQASFINGSHLLVDGGLVQG